MRESRTELDAGRQAFDRFWPDYPRKVAKPEALKAYLKALKRIDAPDPPAVILAGLQFHLAGWTDTEPELIPHPATWLNQDRFDDRPTARGPKLIHSNPQSSFRAQDDDAHRSNMARALAASATAARFQGRSGIPGDDLPLARPDG